MRSSNGRKQQRIIARSEIIGDRFGNPNSMSATAPFSRSDFGILSVRSQIPRNDSLTSGRSRQVEHVSTVHSDMLQEYSSSSNTTAILYKPDFDTCFAGSQFYQGYSLIDGELLLWDDVSLGDSEVLQDSNTESKITAQLRTSDVTPMERYLADRDSPPFLLNVQNRGSEASQIVSRKRMQHIPTGFESRVDDESFTPFRPLNIQQTHMQQGLGSGESQIQTKAEKTKDFMGSLDQDVLVQDSRETKLDAYIPTEREEVAAFPARRPVPGENRPWVSTSATGRETTAPRRRRHGESEQETTTRGNGLIRQPRTAQPRLRRQMSSQPSLLATAASVRPLRARQVQDQQHSLHTKVSSNLSQGPTMPLLPIAPPMEYHNTSPSTTPLVAGYLTSVSHQLLLPETYTAAQPILGHYTQGPQPSQLLPFQSETSQRAHTSGMQAFSSISNYENDVFAFCSTMDTNLPNLGFKSSSSQRRPSPPEPPSPPELPPSQPARDLVDWTLAPFIILESENGSDKEMVGSWSWSEILNLPDDEAER